jgi:hypothetical protein
MANAEDIERILRSELERTHKLYKAEAEKLRIPRDGDQRSELMSITIPK